MEVVLHPGVGFCVWVLVRRGASITPFVHHAARAAPTEMSGALWSEWLDRVIAIDHDARSALLASPLGPSVPNHVRAVLLQQSSPLLQWPGMEQKLPQMRQLWAEYQPTWNSWKREVSHGLVKERVSLNRVGPRSGFVYLVDYPSQVAHPVQPSSVILGAGSASWTLSIRSAAFESAVSKLTG